MKITAVEAIPIEVPLIHTLKMAVATVTKRESIIVRIRTDEGLVGLGEAVIAPYFTGETQRGAISAVETFLAPILLGNGDVFNIHATMNQLNRVLYGNPSIKSAIDVALHDLLAQAMNVPLYRLLGGRVREQVNSTWAISASEPEKAAEEALEGLEQGFQAVKIKVGTGSLQTDIECVRSVRKVTGESVLLRADANQAWSTEKAIKFLKAIEDCQLQFIEQPVGRSDLYGMAKIAHTVDTPVAPDEGLFGAEDALHYIRLDAADGIVMKIMKAGGIAGCQELAAVTHAANLSLHLGGMPGETSISAAAEVHLAVSLPDLSWDTGIYPHTSQYDVVTERMQVTKGSYLPPEKPGLGVELDEAALARCRLDC